MAEKKTGNGPHARNMEKVTQKWPPKMGFRVVFPSFRHVWALFYPISGHRPFCISRPIFGFRPIFH